MAHNSTKAFCQATPRVGAKRTESLVLNTAKDTCKTQNGTLIAMYCSRSEVIRQCGDGSTTGLKKVNATHTTTPNITVKSRIRAYGSIVAAGSKFRGESVSTITCIFKLE